MRRDIARDVIPARKTLISDIDGSDDYWNFIDNPTCENLIENPIHDMSSKGGVYSKICGSPNTSIEGSVDTRENLSMEEEHSEFSHDHPESCHAELHKGIRNEDIEKQYCEKSNVMQSVKYQSQPSSSHIEVPYDLELLGACATSYHLISPGDQYDDVVSLPHLVDWYISPI